MISHVFTLQFIVNNKLNKLKCKIFLLPKFDQNLQIPSPPHHLHSMAENKKPLIITEAKYALPCCWDVKSPPHLDSFVFVMRTLLGFTCSHYELPNNYQVTVVTKIIVY